MNKELREKLSKLLALKNGAASEGEAAAAAAGIQRLLFQHNIEMADFEIEEAVRVEAYVDEIYDIGTPSPSVYVWKSKLLGLIAKNNFCKIVNIDVRNRQGIFKPSGKAHIIGETDNIFAVKITYAYLVEEIRHMTRRNWQVASQINSYPKSYETIWKKSFRMGVLATIASRMDEQRRKDLELIENSTALVVVKNKDLDAATERLIGETTLPRKRRQMILPKAYAGGNELGKSLKLNHEIPTQKIALNK